MFNGFLPARFLVVVCLRLVMEFYRGRGSARIDSASVELRLMSMLLLGRRHAGTSTQGGEITRVTRVFLPWAMMFNAFGVFIGCRKPLSSLARRVRVGLVCIFAKCVPAPVFILATSAVFRPSRHAKCRARPLHKLVVRFRAAPQAIDRRGEILIAPLW